MKASTFLLLLLIGMFATQTQGQTTVANADLGERRVAVLNRLRNEVNATYGFRGGVPRVNLGPCGSFAKAFHEQWNGRFKDKINIAFVMIQAPAGPFCGHIVLKLPDGTYFDGGNGVVTGAALALQFPASRIDEMKEFDLKKLDQNAGGLDRKYETCPNYSDAVTAKLIETHLALLPKDTDHP